MPERIRPGRIGRWPALGASRFRARMDQAIRGSRRGAIGERFTSAYIFNRWEGFERFIIEAV
jgi:hypothetical protein